MKWHEEALDAPAKAAAGRLAAALGRSFYLAGGTALALRLGHRISLDLDLFSRENALRADQRRVLLDKLAASGALRVIESSEGTCHLWMRKTAVSLLHYRYPLLKPVEYWKGLAVASLEDIAAMKLSAAVGRGSKKDFVDLHALCGLLGTRKVLAFGERRFRDHSDFFAQAARALVYFDDADKEPMPRLLKSVSWERVKAFFEREAPRAMRSELGKARD